MTFVSSNAVVSFFFFSLVNVGRAACLVIKGILDCSATCFFFFFLNPT